MQGVQSSYKTDRGVKGKAESIQILFLSLHSIHLDQLPTIFVYTQEVQLAIFEPSLKKWARIKR